MKAAYGGEQCAPIEDVGGAPPGKEVAAMEISEVIELLALVLMAIGLGIELKK